MRPNPDALNDTPAPHYKKLFLWNVTITHLKEKWSKTVEIIGLEQTPEDEYHKKIVFREAHIDYNLKGHNPENYSLTYERGRLLCDEEKGADIKRHLK